MPFLEIHFQLLIGPITVERRLHVLLQLKGVAKHAGCQVDGGNFVGWHGVDQLEGEASGVRIKVADLRVGRAGNALNDIDNLFIVGSVI